MALPSFPLTEIPEGGLSVAAEVQPEEIGLTSEDGKVIGHLFLSADIMMAGGCIDVRGRLGGTFRRQCVRCLNDYDEATEVSFIGVYECKTLPRRSTKPTTGVSRKHGDGAAAVQDIGGDEDPYVCAGDRLELGEMLREHIILAAPMQPLCRYECRGLCQVCGQDRNVTRCECDERGRINPFTVLRESKLQAQRREPVGPSE